MDDTMAVEAALASANDRLKTHHAGEMPYGDASPLPA